MALEDFIKGLCEPAPRNVERKDCRYLKILFSNGQEVAVPIPADLFSDEDIEAGVTVIGAGVTGVRPLPDGCSFQTVSG